MHKLEQQVYLDATSILYTIPLRLFTDEPFVVDMLPYVLAEETQIENSWMYGKRNGTNLTPGCAAVVFQVDFSVTTQL